MVEGELTTENDGTGKWKWTARFETKDYGLYFGFGETEEKAIADVERQANQIMNLMESLGVNKYKIG